MWSNVEHMENTKYYVFCFHLENIILNNIGNVFWTQLFNYDILLLFIYIKNMNLFKLFKVYKILSISIKVYQYLQIKIYRSL